MNPMQYNFRMRDSKQPESTPEQPDTADRVAETSRELDGRKGPDPTRFGDWEKNGRCIDF